ncbi:RNA-directed DNA polymerase [Tanacetum coccineum]
MQEVQFSREEFPPLGNTHIARPCIETETNIDTRASACCINKKVIPKEALEPLTHTVFFNGLNSRQQATHRIKQGYFLIEGNKFKIPLIYAFDMRDSNGIEMLIGALLKIYETRYSNSKGDENNHLQKVTKNRDFKPNLKSVEIAELEVSEENSMK